jgi:hypothetical protein
MGRKCIIILLLHAVLACIACGEREAKEAALSARENAFQNKRICAELGSQRLALDRRKDESESEGVTHGVRAEWCFSAELNTCIYSSTHDVIVTPESNAMASIVLSTQSTIDLLTNRTLISVERDKARQPELEEYEKKRRQIFSKCR